MRLEGHIPYNHLVWTIIRNPHVILTKDIDVVLCVKLRKNSIEVEKVIIVLQLGSVACALYLKYAKIKKNNMLYLHNKLY